MIDFSKIDKEDKEQLIRMFAKQNIDFSSSGNRAMDNNYCFKIRVPKKKVEKKRKNSKNKKNFLKQNIKNLSKIEAKVKVKKVHNEVMKSIEEIKAKKLKKSIERQIKKSKKSSKRNIVKDSQIEAIMAKIFESQNGKFSRKNSNNLMSVERFSELLELGDCAYDDEVIKLKKFDEQVEEFYSDENNNIGFSDLEISQYQHKTHEKNVKPKFDNGTFGEPVNENFCQFYFKDGQSEYSNQTSQPSSNEEKVKLTYTDDEQSLDLQRILAKNNGSRDTNQQEITLDSNEDYNTKFIRLKKGKRRFFNRNGIIEEIEEEEMYESGSNSEEYSQYLGDNMDLMETQKKTTRRSYGEEEFNIPFKLRSSVDPSNDEEVNYLNIESTDQNEDFIEDCENPVKIDNEFIDDTNRVQISATLLDSKRNISFGSAESIFSFKNKANVLKFKRGSKDEGNFEFENSNIDLRNKIKKKKKKSRFERKRALNPGFMNEISNRENPLENNIMRTNQSEDPEQLLFNSKKTKEVVFENSSLSNHLKKKLLKKNKKIPSGRYQQKELRVKIEQSHPLSFPRINQFCFIRMKPFIKNPPAKHPKLKRRFEIERRDRACFCEPKPQFWLNPPRSAILTRLNYPPVNSSRNSPTRNSHADSQKSIRTLKSGRKSNKKSIRLQRSRSFKSINSSNGSNQISQAMVETRVERTPLAQITPSNNPNSGNFYNNRNNYIRISSDIINFTNNSSENFELSHATSMINGTFESRERRIVQTTFDDQDNLPADYEIGFESAQTFGRGNHPINTPPFESSENEREIENIQFKENKRKRTRSKSRRKINADSIRKLVDYSRNENRKSRSKSVRSRKKSVKNLLKGLKRQGKSKKRTKSRRARKESPDKSFREKTIKKNNKGGFVNRKRIKRKGYKKSILDDVLKMQEDEIKGYFKKKRKINIR